MFDFKNKNKKRIRDVNWSISVDFGSTLSGCWAYRFLGGLKNFDFIGFKLGFIRLAHRVRAGIDIPNEDHFAHHVIIACL